MIRLNREPREPLPAEEEELFNSAVEKGPVLLKDNLSAEFDASLPHLNAIWKRASVNAQSRRVQAARMKTDFLGGTVDKVAATQLNIHGLIKSASATATSMPIGEILPQHRHLPVVIWKK